MSDDPYGLTNPLHPLNPGNPVSPVWTSAWTNVWYNIDHQSKKTTFNSNACSCLSETFCKSLDETGNKNGVPENIDIPKDATIFKSLLEGHKISPEKFLQCTQPPEKPKQELTLEEKRTLNTYKGVIAGFGAGLGVGSLSILAMGALTTSAPIWAFVGLFVGAVAIGGALGYFLTR